MSQLTKTIQPAQANEMLPADRRIAARYQITVSAEVIELISGTRFSTRTTDLGPGGCFVDTLMPLPVGSKVRVKLHKNDVSIEATGSVGYSQTGLGMGIAFDGMPPERQRALEAWLAELTQAKPSGFAAPSTPAQRAQEGTTQSANVVPRLVRLLVKRGIISEADAASILKDSIL